MRTLLAFWFAPLVLFWGWYFLSLNDINFGYVMLSRPLHDLAFQLYGETLGVDPAAVPALVAEACVLDSLFVAGIVALRYRRRIASWIRTGQFRHFGQSGFAASEADPKLPAE